MKKLIFIVALLIISCSNQESFEFAEGKILNIEKGAKTGSFEFIDVNVKNKEVRFYSNHDDAVSMGQEPADKVTEKPSNLVGNSSVTTLADAGVGMKGSTKYGGYAISGNIVVLCERELQACLDFIDVLP